MPRDEMTSLSSSLTLLAAVACLAAAPAAAELRLDREGQTLIAVERSGLYPEGIDHDPVTDRFFLSSVRDGAITAVNPDGSHETFAADDRLLSTIGVRVDADRRRLLAANSDYGVATGSTEATNGLAGGLAIFDLDSGALEAYVDLAALRPGAPIFVNDLDVDAAGNVYLTNSLSPVIYKVTPAGEATVLLEHERFAGKGFNLNGIRVHPDGFLLVAKKSDGALFRVPLDAPEAWTEVSLPEPFIGTDGILLAGGRLLLVRNRAGDVVANELVVLDSADGWKTAMVAERGPLEDVYTTTATIRDGEIWAAQGRLHTLRPGGPADLAAFSIQRVGTIVN